jgi:large subunit ribosomal protein L18e
MKTQKISKTKIEKRLQGKSNPILVRTIIQLKKTNPEVAKLLALPKKKAVEFNLESLNNVKEDKVLVPGKILSSGKLTKKMKIVAWSISEKAEERLKDSKSEFISIVDEMKKNPELKDLKLLQ